MSEALSSTEIDKQHMELLPARTVMSILRTAGATTAGNGGGGDGGTGDAGGGGKGSLSGGGSGGFMQQLDAILAPVKAIIPKA